MTDRKKYSVLIVEDDRWSRELTIEWVSMRPELEIAASAAGGTEALAISRAMAASGSPEVDLILLDINMPGMSGIEFLEQLDDVPFVIFTTAHEQYAVKAFEIGAVDYLLKPIERERFDRAIDRFLSVVRDNIPFDIYRVIEEMKDGEKYKKSALPDHVAEQYARQILSYMEERRAYTDEEMTLQKMAHDLAIAPHHMSQVLNTKLNVSFYNFVNSYRVNEAKKLLKSAEYRDARILEILHMAGFKSKSVFNAVFKEFTNITPREYRDGGSVQ